MKRKTKKYVEQSITKTAKVAMNSILIGVVLGGFGWEYVQQASQPVYAFNESEEIEQVPKEVRIAIDYTGWTKARIQEEIRKELPEIFIYVAKCESETRQYYAGTRDVVVGRVDNDDTGLFQVNTRYHLEASKRLGTDIYTPVGNIAYTKHLYATQGLSPWSASKPCWEKYL